MVLSNKKLKQKLRAAKAELIAGLQTQNNFHDKEYQNSGDLNRKISNAPNILQNKDAQRPRLSKREKRRLNNPQGKSQIIGIGEISIASEGKDRDELKLDEVKAKKKKRKRDSNVPMPRLSKREKQKQNAEQGESQVSRVGEISRAAEGKNQDESKSDEVDAKTKKRKRNNHKASDNVKGKKAGESETTKKRKKDRKPKKKMGNGQVKEERREGNGSGQPREDEAENRGEDAMVANKVYVGGIPYYSSEDDIRSYFEGCGTITAIDCMKFPDTGKFRGIAMITFKTEAAAKRALALDGSDMGGLFLKIQPFKSTRLNKVTNFSPSVLEGYNRVYVGNLSWDITEDDLRNLFSECLITSIRFGEDKETGEFKGYAHVDFADGLSLKKALELDQNVVCRRPVKISCAVPKNGVVSKLKSVSRDTQVDSSKGNTQFDSSNVSTINEDQVSMDVSNANSSANTVSSKIRRRTCYECGEKGHLSSACPKNAATDLTNGMGRPVEINCAVPKKETVSMLKSVARDTQVHSGKDSTQFDGSKVSTVTEDQVNTNGANASRSEDTVSSKIRRRTCYECGEKGHLSSNCPKIAAADLTKEMGHRSE